MDPRRPDDLGPSPGPRVRRARTRPAPLPHRDGVPPARFSMPVGGLWGTVAEFLLDRTRGAAEVSRRLADGEVRLGDGTAVSELTPYRPGEWVYLHRDLPEEVPVPGELTVLHEDERLLVVDKPHFLATTPRGRHVRETVLTRLRRRAGWELVQPAHRLDRLTAGVLLLTKQPADRGAYQELFAARAVDKSYLAVVALADGATLPPVVCSRIEKRRGALQAVTVPGEVNAVTRLEVLAHPWPAGAARVAEREPALVRLRPETGRTHQLRVHLAGLGAPIVNDPLYPDVRQEAPDDPNRPLQLLAAELAFTDPVTGRPRRFVSRRQLGGR